MTEYYNPTQWENGDTITADALNNAENGISKAFFNNVEVARHVAGIAFADNGKYSENESFGTTPMTVGRAYSRETGEEVEAENCAISGQGIVYNGTTFVFRRDGKTENDTLDVFIFETDRFYGDWYRGFGVAHYNTPYTVLFDGTLHGSYANTLYYALCERDIDDVANYNISYDWKAYEYERTRLRVKSSTSGSTKKFDITVNDSGTITATEVT